MSLRNILCTLPVPGVIAPLLKKEHKHDLQIHFECVAGRARGRRELDRTISFYLFILPLHFSQVEIHGSQNKKMEKTKKG